MQTIQLKTEEYQLSESTDNLFQLRPLPSQSSAHLDLEYNFAPLICSKTEKIISTLPSISQEKSNSTLFQTQIDLQFNLKAPSLNNKPHPENIKSMKTLAQTEKAIFVSKPSSQYCQICKETFSDYLQHINHSSHQKKLKEGAVTDKDFLEIQSILKKKNLHLEKKEFKAKSEKKVALVFNQDEKMRKRESKSNDLAEFDSKGAELNRCETKVSRSIKFVQFDEEEENLGCLQSLGSKKRIVENSSGEKECVGLSSAKFLNQPSETLKKEQEAKLVSEKIIQKEVQ